MDIWAPMILAVSSDRASIIYLVTEMNDRSPRFITPCLHGWSACRTYGTPYSVFGNKRINAEYEEYEDRLCIVMLILNV